MATWSISNHVRTPMLLMACIESSILCSSVYVAGISTFGSLTAAESALGPLALRATALTSVVLVCMVAMGIYQFHQRMRFREMLPRIVAAVLIGTGILALMAQFVPELMLTQTVAALATLYSIPLLLVVRYFFVRTVDENIFRRRTLIYGAGARASSIFDLRRKADRRGFQIVGRITPPSDRTGQDGEATAANSLTVLEAVARTQADEVVIAMDERRGNLPIRELLDTRLRGIEVIDLMEFLERETGKIRVDLVNPGWLIFSAGFRASMFARVCKRIVDITISGILLLLSFPLVVLIAVAIKIEDGIRAPVFYRQYRVGKRNRRFSVLKFRSMREDAESDGQAVWAQAKDDRVTRVGRFLRVSRLDELPQIVNVFKGEMSFVGPRPERPEFVQELQERVPYYSERHTVAPGITGWAQLKYGYGSSEEDAIEKLQYDLYYVKNHGLLLDLLIILQTVEVVLWGKGAR